MEPAGFLNQTQCATIKIISWNINGAKTKLEKAIVQSVLFEYNLISLDEVKTSLPVSLPGYLSLRSNINGSAERGGTTVLVKNYLAKNVVSVQTDVRDQIWVRFRCIPKCFFFLVSVTFLLQIWNIILTTCLLESTKKNKLMKVKTSV